MNKENKLLQAQESVGEYLAPGVRVIEVMVRRVMCASPTGGAESGTETDDYD